MLANKNNLKSELTANVWVLDTTISITSGEWILWENNMVACLEHYEDGVCTKREIVKITAKNNDTFTVTRWFAVCIMNDETKQQGQWSQAFSVGDFLSLYLSKELRESITQNIWINETALQTMVWHISAPRTCINNNCLSWKWSIDSAYNSKYWWIAWFGDASDGDCVITTNDLDSHWFKYFCASCEYNFNNLTICPWVTIRFLWSWVPRINVRNNFVNCGCIELKSWFVSNNNLTDCRLEQWCQICNQRCDRWACCGWRWWCGWYNGSPWSSGCNWTASCGWAGWTGWQWCAWCPASWCNGWKWWSGESSNRCNGGGWWWWWGGWWIYWNGGDWWDGWYNWSAQMYWWEWWKGWNSGLFGHAWNGGAKWNAYSWNGWKGGDWWDGWIWWNGYSVGDRTSDQPWSWWKGVLCGWKWWSWTWWSMRGANGGDAITNVYWLHLNARNIWNKCVDARWWQWWNGGDTVCWTSWSGWNGANGWQMVISYDCMHEQWCFDVRGWAGWCRWNVSRPACWAYWNNWTAWTDWRVIFRTVNNPYITNFNLENDSDNESILITWKDPTLKASSPNPRKKTIVRVSTVNYPASITDWTLVVNETTKNQYESTPFSMSATDGVTYYFTAFAIAQDDTMIDVQTNSIEASFDRKPTVNTVLDLPFVDDLLDHSLTPKTVNSTGTISITTFNWIKCASVNNGWVYSTLTNDFTNLTINMRVYDNSSSSYENMYWSLWTWSRGDFSFWVYDLKYYYTRHQISSNVGESVQRNSWVLITIVKTWNNWKFYKNCQLIIDTTKTDTQWYSNKTITIWKRYFWTGSYHFIWYVWRSVVEDISRSESNIQDFYEKTKSKYWY